MIKPVELENVRNVNRCDPKPVIAGNVPPPRLALTVAEDVRLAFPETSITPHPSIFIVEDTTKSPLIVTVHMMVGVGEEMVTLEFTTQDPSEEHTAPANGDGQVPEQDLSPQVA